MNSEARNSGHRGLLIFLFKAVAVVTLFAIPAVFMPHSWLDWFHRLIGLGELPDLPIISYATRSLSGFYAWFALLILFAIRDVDRYLPFLRFFSITGFLFGFVLTGIDLWSKLPWWWTVSEGVFVFAFFGTTWWLCNRVAEESQNDPAEQE